jgi:hypothetical protein
MNRRIALAIGLAASLFATAASAMPVSEFLRIAAGIPQNPTALLRSDTRRLMGEFRGAVLAARNARDAARTAGRRPPNCMPDKVQLSPNEILRRFNAIPAARRNISVTQAVGEWMAERYPCPA